MEYRARLFGDYRTYSSARVARVLEVGPKDGLDTRRLLTLKPKLLTLVDLPGRDRVNIISGGTVIEHVALDVLTIPAPKPLDLIWCTGVLYHVKEQYRLIRHFYDWLVPGGTLVLESATIRKWWLRRANVVEILHPPSEEVKRRYHLSLNVTHLPSRRAIESWLHMAGFTNITRSSCHGWWLGRNRAAFLATK